MEAREYFQPQSNYIVFIRLLCLYCGVESMQKCESKITEWFQFTDSKVTTIRRMDHNLKMFDVQQQEHNPPK